mgnify:CR=1 FL=1
MTKKQDIHVVPHSDGWATRKEGTTRAGSIHRTQKEAQQKARQQAKREKVEVVVNATQNPQLFAE